MELEIRRRESTGSGTNTYVETETLAKFELMDGAPVRGTNEILFLVYPFSRGKLKWKAESVVICSLKRL